MPAPIARALLVAALAILPTTSVDAQSQGPENDRGNAHPRGLWDADTDHDGQLTREELTAYLSARFAALDTDGDGTVSLTTLAQRDGSQRTSRVGADAGSRRGPPPGGAGGPPPGGPGGGPGGPPPGGHRGPPPEARGGEAPPPHDGLPRPEDRNEDGQIDRAEYLAPIGELLETRDANGDGMISSDELPPPPPPPSGGGR